MNDDQRREIEELVEILSEHQLTELEIEKKGTRIRVRRDASPVVSSSTIEPQGVVEPPRVPEIHFPHDQSDQGRFITVTSPIVGTFYRSPSPDAEQYVEEGDFTKKGQVLCIVEAMKLMNEIESEADGRIVKILVENSTSVEYGQPLFLIDPMAGP